MKGLIFTYLLTYGGAAASLFNPFIGLLVYICFAIARPESLWPWSVQPGNYSRTVAIALLIGWALQGFGRWNLGRARAMVVMIILYGIWMVFTTRYAIDQELAWRMVEETFKIILPFLVGITTITSIRQLKQMAWVIVLSEGYVAWDLNRTYLDGYNRLWFEGFGSLDNNGNAVALVTSVGAAFFLALYSKGWLARFVATATGLLMIHAILFSFSRGGMLALVITGFVTFWLIPKRFLHYAVFALLALIVVRLAGDEVADRFRQAFIMGKGIERSADARLMQWEACRRSIMQSPLGLGPDQWKLHSMEFGLPLGQAAHSTWLQVGVELGVPGVSLLLLFYLICLRRLGSLARGRVQTDDPWHQHLARMVTASLLGFMFAAQFVTLHKLEIAWYIALIGAGILKIATTHLEADRRWPTHAYTASRLH
jgi:O-antigen ligase